MREHDEPWSAEKLAQASFKDLGSPTAVEQRFFQHLLSNETCRRSLRALLAESSTTTRDYSIEIDTYDVLEKDPILGHLLLRYPAALLPVLVNAVVRGQENLLVQQEPEEDGASSTAQWVKGQKSNGAAATRVHARLVNLPPSCWKTSLASMQAADVGKILQVSGTVVRANPVQMYESTRTYKCSGKKGCGRNFVVHADLEQRQNALQPPGQCPLQVEGGGFCQGTSFKAVDGGSLHTDYQELKIQEAASNLEVGHIPRSLLIKLQNDLVDRCQPGDEVVVVGSLLAQWQQHIMQPDLECSVGLAMSAHSVRVVADKNAAWQDASGNTSMGQMEKYEKEFTDYWNDPANKQNPIAARDFISKAVCPNLYGMKVVKLALLLALVGGVNSDACAQQDSTDQGQEVNHVNESDEEFNGPVPFQFCTSHSNKSKNADSAAYYGDTTSNRKSRHQKEQQVKTRRRDQSHLLLVGDPGTGKSQFLRFAAALCPRAVLTTGVGTTSAGLTCAAVREGNSKEFSLEAGALVLADKGVCCIDEFGCIQEKDRTTIHEAMEQQTLSVAKAGIVCKLNCRACVIAVMNPKNCLYDNHASLSINTGLGTPLLSRFDLIFKLMDTSDAERDSNITTYLLNRAIIGTGLDVSDKLDGEKQQATPWKMEKLRAYITIVKERFQPIINDAAAALLEYHYEKCRSAQNQTLPVTVRFLESLIRLSQAHAKLMFRSVVTLEDAAAIVEIMECSAFAYGGFDGRVDDPENALYCDPMTVDYEEDVDSAFLCYQYQLLQRYQLLNLFDDERRRSAEATIAQSTPVDDWDQTDYQTVQARSQQTVVTQDHYGRYHFGQPTPNKRPRCR